MGTGLGPAAGHSRRRLKIEPLPWPAPGISAAAARRPHGHCCASCGDSFECAGPQVTGTCAPVCPPCCWIELGSQLRLYREIVEEITDKRSEIEQRVGKHVCHMAEIRRRKGKNAPLLIAFGNVMLQRGVSIEPGSNRRLRPRGGTLS
jgi:hypothetical protein